MPWPPDANPVLELEASSPVSGECDVPVRLITWIPWDSGFRGSGLRVGDFVVAHGDVRYTAELLDKREGLMDAYFSRWFDQQRFKPDDPITLTVLRDDKELLITGKIGGWRSYKNEKGDRILGAGGPVEYEKDGMDYAWNSWYRQFVDLAKTVLIGWDYFTGTNTKGLTERIAPFAERVAFLEKTYPGAFAQSVRADFDAMQVMVAGQPRKLTESDLAYRTLGPIRAKAVTEAADAAFSAFLAEVQGQLMADAPAAPNSFTEDTRGLIGKTIRLPELTKREVLFETGRSWYWSGRSGGGYLIHRQSPSLEPFYNAHGEYVEKVDPYFRDQKVSFIGVVQPEPTLVVDAHRNITVSGLRLEPIAALVANASDASCRYFVDLRPGKGTEAFAGEAALDAGIQRKKLADDAPPEQVLMTAFDAMKLGDMETWLNCYAKWLVRSSYEKDQSYLYVDLTWEIMNGRSSTSSWDQARKRLMDDIFAIEIARVGAVRTVFDAAAQAGSRGQSGPTKVEEVFIKINHIGKVGDEFRTCALPMTRRRWELQRLDNGPWRITSTYAI